MMSTETIVLSLALITLLFLGWRREKFWRRSVRTIGRRLGMVQGSAGIPSVPDLLKQVEILKDTTTSFEGERYLRQVFEALLNEIRQGVVIVDDQLRVRFANRTMANLFRRDSMRTGSELFAEIQDHQIIDAVRDATENRSRAVREVRSVIHHQTMGATVRHLLIEAAPLPAESKPGAWLMIQDISDQVMADQIRKDFVANASHELRTPLTLIQGYIETLRQGGLQDAELAEHSLAVMEKHGNRIIRIIEDMLTISKLEDAETSLSFDPFLMKDCVTSVVDHLRPMMDEAKVSVEIDFPDDGGPFRGDRFYWDQVFNNLIENALKENPNRELGIRVSGKWYSDYCEIRVTDTGVGIAAHDLPFVFKRFYRGHKHHGQTIKGTGLGLSIVRRAIEAHGGKITLSSTPGVETTFVIWLPLHQDSKPSQQDASSTEPPAPPPEDPPQGPNDPELHLTEMRRSALA